MGYNVGITKMFTLFVVSLCVQLSVGDVALEGVTQDQSELSHETKLLEENIEATTIDDIEQDVRNFEEIGTKDDNEIDIIQNNHAATVSPADEIFHKMTDSINRLLEKIQKDNNIYKFLKVDGITRVISPNLGIENSQLRKSILILTKKLFEKAQTTVTTSAPLELLEDILKIFTDDNNLANKAYALDILNIWLPNNPKVQARVMRITGLDPFYELINSMDSGSVGILLSLFNKILDEHMEADNHKFQKNDEDYTKYVTYQRIGLIERMSTVPVCRGLLEIFRKVLVFSQTDNEVIVPVLNLVPKVNHFCKNFYKRSARAGAFLTELIKFLENPDKTEYFNGKNVNVTNLLKIAKDFQDKLRNEKDEF